MIRKATRQDIASIIRLLHQVDMVHHRLRPDLFKPDTTKYGEQELSALLSDVTKPVFVYEEDGKVVAHAFCQISEVKNDRLLVDGKMMYTETDMLDWPKGQSRESTLKRAPRKVLLLTHKTVL